MMLVYFKNRHGQVTETDVEPQETMKEVVTKIEELGGLEKVRINVIVKEVKDDFEMSRKRLEIPETVHDTHQSAKRYDV